MSKDYFDDPQFQREYAEWSESIEPSLEEYDAGMCAMQIEEVTNLYNACHDYGKVVTGEFPTLDAVLLALDENRLQCWDSFNNGYLTITGKDACHIVFSTD